VDTGKNDELEPDFDGTASGEDDEAWFEADALAEASEVELGRGLLGPAYGVEDLAADRARRGLDLGSLPTWPGGPDSGHGWGPALSRLVGRMGQGHRVLVDAGGPGHGRSGFVLQLADGLALRNSDLAASDPLTPVVVVAEDGREEAGRRSLARWTGHEARVFRHGREGAARLEGWSGPEVERAFAEAEQALGGHLGSSGSYCRHVGGRAIDAHGSELVPALSDEVRAWCASLEADGRPIWPVVVVDGLRALASSEAELEAVARALSAAARRGGWILLATERAVGDRLDPWFDLRLTLDGDVEAEKVRARVAHHRGGPSGGEVHYAWSPQVGRYEPLG
jgi:hypothetical protein